MMNFSEKRKHFRFPAYDDESGVKLNRPPQQSSDNAKRTVSNQENDTVILDPIEMVAEPKYFGGDGLPEVEIERAEPTRSVQQQINVKKPKTPLTSKTTVPKKPVEKTVNLNTDNVEIKTMNNQVYAEPSKQEYKAPQSSFSNKLYETDRNGQAKYRKRYNNRKPFESSYHLPGENPQDLFKPKYIPASLIEDKPVSKSVVEPTQVIKDLRKAAEDNFLMMDELDPAEMVDETTKTPKVTKKNHRLEKSLSGIMQDESSQHLDNFYFD